MNTKENMLKYNSFFEYNGEKWTNIPNEVRKLMPQIPEKAMKNLDGSLDLVWDWCSGRWILR